jgi:hypothetical protein
MIDGEKVVSSGGTVPLALRGGGLIAAARSADGGVVAAVRSAAAGDSVVVGDASGPLQVALRGAAAVPPTFGPNRQAIAVTSTGSVYSVAPNAPPHPVTVTGRLSRAAVRGLALSVDGTRVAVVAATPNGNELDVATVVASGARIEFRRPRVVIPASSHVSGVGWAGASEIVSTITTGTRQREVVEVGSDGFQVQDLSGPGLPSDLNQVAASSGQRLLAADSVATWQLSGRRWRRLSSAVRPTYAGG